MEAFVGSQIEEVSTKTPVCAAVDQSLIKYSNEEWEALPQLNERHMRHVESVSHHEEDILNAPNSTWCGHLR